MNTKTERWCENPFDTAGRVFIRISVVESPKLKMVPKRAKKMSHHLSPFSPIASTFLNDSRFLSEI